METPINAQPLPLRCYPSLKARHFPTPSLVNDMRWHRITSRSWPWPLLVTAEINPVLSGTRIDGDSGVSKCLWWQNETPFWHARETLGLRSCLYKGMWRNEGEKKYFAYPFPSQCKETWWKPQIGFVENLGGVSALIPFSKKYANCAGYGRRNFAVPMSQRGEPNCQQMPWITATHNHITHSIAQHQGTSRETDRGRCITEKHTIALLNILEQPK